MANYFLIPKIPYLCQKLYCMSEPIKTDGRKSNGGHKTAGRKAVDDPKIPVQFYAHTSHIEALGGIEAARSICSEHIQNEAIRINKK